MTRDERNAQRREKYAIEKRRPAFELRLAIFDTEARAAVGLPSAASLQGRDPTPAERAAAALIAARPPSPPTRQREDPDFERTHPSASPLAFIVNAVIFVVIFVVIGYVVLQIIF